MKVPYLRFPANRKYAEKMQYMKITIDCNKITHFCHPTSRVSEHVFGIKHLTTSKVQQTKSTSVSYQTKVIKQPEEKFHFKVSLETLTKKRREKFSHLQHFYFIKRYNILKMTLLNKKARKTPLHCYKIPNFTCSERTGYTSLIIISSRTEDLPDLRDAIMK